MEGTSTGTVRGLTTQSLSTSPEGAVGIPAGSRYLLVVEQESARVHPLPAEGRILIGREAGEGGLALAATTASRRHAMLRVSAEEISVTDLSSHNGTCVNGRPIQHMTALRNGDVIAVAGALLVLKQQRPVAVASGASMTYLQCSVSSARVRMTAALESAAQYARPLSLIEFSLGEQAVLQDTAAALAVALPSTSMVIGLGGSARLIILLPDSEEADAVTQAQQLGIPVRAQVPGHHDGPGERVGGLPGFRVQAEDQELGRARPQLILQDRVDAL